MDFKYNIKDVIDLLVTPEDVNYLLTKQDSKKILKQVLDYKAELISSNDAVRRDFSVAYLYQGLSGGTSDVIYSVLRLALFIQETDKELNNLISYVNSLCPEEKDLQLFFVLLKLVFEVCEFNKRPEKLLLLNITNIENMVLAAIKSSDRKLSHKFLLEFLPKYFTYFTHSSHSVDKFYNCILGTGDLALLCSFLNNSFNYIEIIHCSFLKNEQFWLFIEDCISNKDPYSQKLGIFILSKTINFIYKNYTISYETPFIINENNKFTIEMKDTWVIYFHLLDISREKQLHLIEPCLGMFDQIVVLPLLWQTCIYTLFLKHSQNSVTYYTAEKVFSGAFNEQILHCALQALNKNDHSLLFQRVFVVLKHYCSNLSAAQSKQLLEEWLHISWNPTALWYFCKNVLTDKTFEISFMPLLAVLRKIENLPHIFIRSNCLKIVLNRFLEAKLNISFEELIPLFQILYNFNKEQFKTYVIRYKHIFEKYSSQFNSIVDNWTVVKENDNNQCEMILLIIFHLNLDHVFTYIKQNMFSFNEDLKEMIYLHFFEKFSDYEVEQYLKEKQPNSGNLERFFLLLKKITTRGYPQNLPNVVFCVMAGGEEAHFNLENQTLLSIKNNESLFSKDFLKSWISENIGIIDNVDGVLCSNLIELYFDIFLNENCEDLIDKLQTFKKLTESLLYSKDDTVILKIFEMSPMIFKILNEHFVLFLDFLNLYSKEIIKLATKPIFEKAVKYFLMSIYNIKHLTDLNYRNEILRTTKNLMKVLKQNECFFHTVMQYYKTLSVHCPDLLEDFIPLIVEAIFHGMTTNKGERTEYFICQEIAEYSNTYFECPNVLKMQIRLMALECLSTMLAAGNENISDVLISVLMSRYRQFYRKRYFPDSQVHFQYLRILQSLLMFHPYIANTKEELQNFLMDSFCEEIHQSCVRQLMQWLLILLLKDSCHQSLILIKNKMDSASRTQPSTIVAFIPVLYHLALLNDEKYCSDVIEVFLLWTMGAHFKLRVYSQVAIIKLYKNALLKDYECLTQKYRHLYSAVIEIMKNSQEQFCEILKTDSEFFDLLDPCRDFSLETIFVDIPRMNKVFPSEWENVMKYTFTNLHVKVTNESRILSDHISKNCDSKLRWSFSEEDKSPTFSNIQKKITPWKTFLDDNSLSKNVTEFILVANDVEKPANLGGLSRTCEIFGVKHLVISNRSIIKNAEFKSLSMSSENWVDYLEVKTEETPSFIQNIKSAGYTVIGAEQTSESISLCDYKFPRKCALVLGNEKEGIPADLMPFLDLCIEIPQFGVVRSLNVHVAGALFMWEYTKQNLT